jgi:hypothetical protein
MKKNDNKKLLAIKLVRIAMPIKQVRIYVRIKQKITLGINQVLTPSTWNQILVFPKEN